MIKELGDLVKELIELNTDDFYDAVLGEDNPQGIVILELDNRLCGGKYGEKFLREIEDDLDHKDATNAWLRMQGVY